MRKVKITGIDERYFLARNIVFVGKLFYKSSQSQNVKWV